MFCQNCGKEIKAGVRFCPSCGAKVAVINSEAGNGTPKANSINSDAGNNTQQTNNVNTEAVNSAPKVNINKQSSAQNTESSSVVKNIQKTSSAKDSKSLSAAGNVQKTSSGKNVNNNSSNKAPKNKKFSRVVSIVIVIIILIVIRNIAGSNSSNKSSKSAKNTVATQKTKDKWGTKNPTSANYYCTSFGEKGPYSMTFDYKNDGSYTCKIQFKSYDIVYYYAANGTITKEEKYWWENGRLLETLYFNNGICMSKNGDEDETYGTTIFFGPGLRASAYAEGIFNEFNLITSYANVKYDEEGNISGINIFDTKGYYAKYKDFIIEKDNQGRITKTDLPSADSYFDYCTEYVYNDNTIEIRSYTQNNMSFNEDTRTKGTKSYARFGIKITLNSHGAIERVNRIYNKDGSDLTDDVAEYLYEYDEYGNLTLITKTYGTKGYLRIEYTY